MKNMMNRSVKLLMMGLGMGLMMTAGIGPSRANVFDQTPLILAANAAIPPNPDCPIKGNISHNSGNRYYHLPGMPDYEITLIDVARGERWFCSEAEAIAAGWSKAPIRHHHNR